MSSPNFLDWQAQTRTLDAVALIGGRPVTLTGSGDAELIQAMTVSPDFVRVMSARPALGRLFTPADYAPMAAQFQQPAQRERVQPNVVISARSVAATVRRAPGNRGQHRAPGRPERRSRRRDAAGLRVHRDPGVGPRGLLAATGSRIPSAARRMFTVVGRLAPGLSLAQAQAEFDIIASQLAVKYPRANEDRGIRLSPLLQAETAAVRVELWLLLGAARVRTPHRLRECRESSPRARLRPAARARHTPGARRHARAPRPPDAHGESSHQCRRRRRRLRARPLGAAHPRGTRTARNAAAA